MCGICGFLGPGGSNDGGAAERLVRRMADAIAHRGPDGEGAWSDPEAGIALGHRRLAIVDLSPLGRQPMVSADGRWRISFNGEIYNYQDLRRELEADGVAFRSSSDTEVLLEACARHGVAATLKRTIGIFAFALWDGAERTLYLARDQLGVKPLYWSEAGDTLLFASQPKALRPHPAFRADLDLDALTAYLRFGYVPAPLTIFAGVRKLEPGTLLTVRRGRPPELTAYWSLDETIYAARREPLLDDEEAAEALEALLTDAVGRQMVADVPLGAFLSGGIDSSTVVALMQAQSARPVRTFTVGFREGGHDESAAARAVARHLGTDHTELTLNAAEALATIPDLAGWYDEPFADSSQIPTLLVSRLARGHVTVALSGDGGDELFAGYNRHVMGAALWPRLDRVPAGLRRTAAAALKAVPPGGWDRAFALVPEGRRPRQPGDKLHKLATVLAAEGSDDAYRRLVSVWDAPEGLLRGGRDTRAAGAGAMPAGLTVVESMQRRDMLGYLPDDILTKVDRASMAVSLEARVPLLDPRVVAFAWRLPPGQKIRDGRGKWLLRRVLHRHVPAALVERPKSGFAIPLDEWLRGPLRGWSEALLDRLDAAGGGALNAGPVRARWAEHLSGRRNWGQSLWCVLAFAAWHERWRRGAG